MRHLPVALSLSLVVGGILFSASARENAWPFAILRNYGSYEDNRDFLERAFAAQERHPGLVEEIWFAGCGRDLFADPETLGARAFELNRAAKPICERLGIAFSYQQGVTLNHDPDDRDHPGIPDDAWVVDRYGKTRKGLFCCTSPFVIDYSYRKAKAILSALKPDSYWPDDDLRILKVDWGRPGICFCPRCLKLFGARQGRAHTRESLLSELDPMSTNAVAATRRAWCAFNGESLANYAATFRRAVDEVSPETRLGLQGACSRFTANGDLVERTLKFFAGGKGCAGIRPGGGWYSDLDRRSGLLDKMSDVACEAARAARWPATGQICYEAENWPHIGAIKNPHAMMAECALALAFGCDSIAFYWGADQNGETAASYDYFFETMHAWRPFHLAVRDAFRGTSLGGVAVCHGEDWFATPNWFSHKEGAWPFLGQNGLPMSVAESAPDVWLVNWVSATSLSRADLEKVFSRPVLVDPGALTTLKSKFPDLGFLKKIEIRFLEDERALATVDRTSGYERFASIGKCENVTALIRPKSADVVPFSVMTADTNACGTCVVPTEFGGKVVVAQDIHGTWAHPCWPGCRRHGVLDALDAAVPGGMPARLLTDGYAVSVTVRKTPDGKTAGVFLLNLGGGETPPLELAIRHGAGSAWTVRRPRLPDRPAEVVRSDVREVVLRVPSLPAFGAVLVDCPR